MGHAVSSHIVHIRVRVIGLNTLKGTTIPLTELILDFSTLRGTKPRILTPETDTTITTLPRHVYMGVPHPRDRTE